MKTDTQRGFTLVEMMMALAVGSLIMVLVLSAFSALSSSLASAESYRDIHHDVRYAMDFIKRDIARGSEVSSCVTNSRLALVTGSNKVSVVYNLTDNIFSRTDSGSVTNLLVSGVESVSFSLYDASGTATSSPTNAYFVDVKMNMQTHGVRDTYTDELQTRVRMRGKGL